MERIYRILLENPVVGFCTVDEDNKPQARAFQVMGIVQNKIYFFTGAGKQVYKQMVNNSIAFTVTSRDYVSIRISGKPVFVEEMELRKEFFDTHPDIKSLYKAIDNPALKLFYVDIDSAEIFDLSNYPPKREKLV